MDLLQTIVVSILSGFLALSGTLAGFIEDGAAFITREKAALEDIADKHEPVEFTTIPSAYDVRAFPRILLENARYQQAAVGSILPVATPDVTTPVPEQLESAVVNIFCTLTTAESQRITTGSGVFIDPRGVILTNAHVAQFLLLEEETDGQRTTCSIRTGNPATARYEAELLYISPYWVEENASVMHSENPTGTGERDYALLYVSSADTGELPEAFPHLQVDTELVTRALEDVSVYAGGYPAEILAREGSDAELAPKVDNTTVVDFFTFGSGYADLITIADSELGEHGSSGGAVVTEDGSIVGLIVTKGDADRNGARSLRALTLSYIDRTIHEETGYGLSSTLSGDLTYRSEIFKEALVPFLRTTLTQEAPE